MPFARPVNPYVEYDPRESFVTVRECAEVAPGKDDRPSLLGFGRLGRFTHRRPRWVALTVVVVEGQSLVPEKAGFTLRCQDIVTQNTLVLWSMWTVDDRRGCMMPDMPSWKDAEKAMQAITDAAALYERYLEVSGIASIASLAHTREAASPLPAPMTITLG
jgi:hypothetical protein